MSIPLGLRRQVELLDDKIRKLQRKNRDLLEEGRGKTKEERKPIKTKIDRNKRKIRSLIEQRSPIKLELARRRNVPKQPVDSVSGVI